MSTQAAANGRVFRGGCEGAVGVVEVPLKAVEVTGHHCCPPDRHAQHRVRPDDRFGQRPQPREQQCVATLLPRGCERLFDESAGTVEVLAGERVPDGVLERVAGCVPVGRVAVQLVHDGGVTCHEACAEDVGEQVVVSEPGPVVVERHDEQVVAVEAVEERPAVRLAGDGGAQAPGETLQHGGAQQELAHLGGLLGKDLVGEVVHHEPVAARERLDERRHVTRTSPATQREPRQLQSCGPSFGAVVERLHVSHVQVEPHDLVEEVARLLRSEPQVRGPAPRSVDLGSAAGRGAVAGRTWWLPGRAAARVRCRAGR